MGHFFERTMMGRRRKREELANKCIMKKSDEGVEKNEPLMNIRPLFPEISMDFSKTCDTVWIFFSLLLLQ